MKTGFIGVGEMGELMAGHIAGRGHEVYANDALPARVAGRGYATWPSPP